MISGSRLFYQLTPEYGAGYYLGIAGGFLMLLLLAYPLKKRIRGAPIPFSARFWFRLHMQLGIAGPALIFLHSRFTLGSTNSTIAFVFMVTVMVSGLIGRFLYKKVHISLYGRRRDLGELLQELKEHIDERARGGFALPASLASIEPGNDRSAYATLIFPLRHLRKTLRDHKYRRAFTGGDFEEYGRRDDDWIERVDNLLGRCINLMVYERIFSWWHYLHLPIFFAFVLATVAHILAVHIY